MEDASANQDSAVHSTSDYQNRRHRRFLVIFVTTMGLVGVAVAIVLASVYGNVAFTEAKPSARQQEGFTLDEVLSGKFYAESFNGTWISGSLTNLRSYKLLICLLESFFRADHEFGYRTAQYGINIYDVKTSTAKVMVKPEIVVRF